MVVQILALSALLALTQAKAIVTNNCKHNVYLWSVPGKSGVADNLPIGPGKRYEEPWRYGTTVNPGIAIKVSPVENGINKGKAEINFQYTVDSYDSSKIWINLSLVRSPLPSDVVLFTCHGPYRTPNVPTRQCSYTDDVELVLCGTRRSAPPQDKTSPGSIHDCIGRNHKHDATIRPHQCNGRVIGPKPKHEAHGRRDDDDDGTHIDVSNPFDDEDEITAPVQDTSGDHKQSVTVPLKHVMRHEAAKHAVTKHAEVTKRQPFCDLIKSHWPEAACDEDISQQNARLFYKDNCGKKTKNLLTGADCQKLRQEIKKMFPDVDKEPKAKVVEYKRRTLCSTKAHGLLDPLWGERQASELMNGLFTDLAWTSDEDICYHGKGNSTAHPTRRSRERRCVKPYCEPNVAPSYCSDVEDVLQEISKLAGYEIDWTSSSDECGHDWKRNGNKTLN